MLPFPAVINQRTALPCHTCGISQVSVAFAVEIKGCVPNYSLKQSL